MGLVEVAPEKSTDLACVRRSTLVWALTKLKPDIIVHPTRTLWSLILMRD